MIAKLTGVLDQQGDDWVVVDVNGVGYLIFCSSRTLTRLPASEEPVSLQIETHVREDHIHLYGFLDAAERDWFRLLLSVQGVGAKVALAILSVMSADDLRGALVTQDPKPITRANGVGNKVAQRIVNELKDKAGGIPVTGDATFAAAATGVRPAAATPQGDAVSALVNLGYRQADALAAVARVSQAQGSGVNLQALITASLKELTR